MKKIIYFLLAFSQCGILHAQNKKIDSLQTLLKTAKEDTNKVNTLNALGHFLRYSEQNNALNYAKEAMFLSKKTNFKKGEARAYQNLELI